MSDDSSHSAFVEEAEAIFIKNGVTEATFTQIGSRLQELARSTIIAEEHLTSLHGSGATATILARGPQGSVLMLARFPSESETPIHNHNTWGVACVIQGRDRYRKWDRTDDGSNPETAEIKLVWERELSPGDFVGFGEPPDDIHSQQGIGDAAWELVYFGKDPNAQPRAYFDQVTGTVGYAEASR